MSRGNLPYRILHALAAQRAGAEAEKCHTIFELFRISTAMRADLRRDLTELGLTEPGFSLLVTLYATDPAPSSVASVATHTGATRTTTIEAAHWLESRALIRRTADRHDRRLVYFHLTDGGRKTAERALSRVIDQIVRLSRRIATGQAAPTLAVCSQLGRALRPTGGRRRKPTDAGQCCDLG